MLTGLALRILPLATILALVNVMPGDPSVEALLSTFVIANAFMLLHVLVGYPLLLKFAVQPGFDLKECTSRLLGACLLAATAMAVLVLLATPVLNAFLTAGKPTSAMQESLHWLAPWLLLVVGCAPLRGALSLRGYFNLTLALQVSTFVILGIVAFLFPEWVRPHLTRTYVLLVVVETGVTYFLTWRLLRFTTLPHWSRTGLRGIGVESRWLVLGFLLQSLLYAMDIPTAAMAGEGAVTVFQSVFRVPFLIMWSVSGAVASLIGVAMSARSELIASAAELRSTLQVALKVAGLAAFLSLCVTGSLIAAGVAGEVSARLWGVAFISALMLPAWAMTSVLSKFFDLWDIQHYLPFVYVGVLGVRLLVAYPLIHSFGFIGVALTLLAGQLTLLIGHSYFIWKAVRLRIGGGN